MANELNIPGFKHYELDSTYQAKLAAGEVNAKDLSFVKETGKIYTQGGEYGGGGLQYVIERTIQAGEGDELTSEQMAYNAETFSMVNNMLPVVIPFMGYVAIPYIDQFKGVVVVPLVMMDLVVMPVYITSNGNIEAGPQKIKDFIFEADPSEHAQHIVGYFSDLGGTRIFASAKEARAYVQHLYNNHYYICTVDVCSKYTDTSISPNEIGVIEYNFGSQRFRRIYSTATGALVKEEEIQLGGEDITVDSALSTTSTNPVQNKVITTKVNDIDTRVQDIESFFEEGAKLNLTIKSNQASDSSISAVKATVSYDGKSVQLGSGVIGLPVFTDVTITFPEVSGYKVPAPIVFTTGAVPVVYEATYETEIVRVTVNSWNGASVVGQIITINGTQYTWNGSTIQHKVPFGVEYEISCNAKDGFTEPAVVTNIASQVRRDVSLTYTDVIGTWITLNQTITDPATMISGDVNGEDIQLIRNNSHRYLGKYTAEGTMTVCQLDDTDSNFYADGTSAVLTGAEGDVFMKLPKFYYIAKEKATNIWAIGFYYGNSAPSSSWKEWDGNDLIGVYQIYASSGIPYSRSSMKPSYSVTQKGFKDMASARGTGFSLVKWKHHNIMAFLFYAMYGNMNSQAVVGTNVTGNDRSGSNDSLGMTDTVAGGDPSVDGNTTAINFWGLEDWWGDSYEYIDNVIADKDGVTWKITEDDGSERVITGSKLGGFMQKALIGAELDLIPSSTTNATATTGYCDSVLSNQRYSNCIVMRSNASNYPAGGIAYLSANSLDSETNGSATSRLCFRGTIIEEQSSETFKSLTAIG